MAIANGASSIHSSFSSFLQICIMEKKMKLWGLLFNLIVVFTSIKIKKKKKSQASIHHKQINSDQPSSEQYFHWLILLKKNSITSDYKKKFLCTKIFSNFSGLFLQKTSHKIPEVITKLILIAEFIVLCNREALRQPCL